MDCSYKSKRIGDRCSLSAHVIDPNLGDGRYCPFHLPLDASDSYGIKKSDWGLKQLEGLASNFSGIYKNHISMGKPLDLSGAIINWPMHVDNNPGIGELYLDKCEFHKRFLFNGRKVGVKIFGDGVKFFDHFQISDVANSSILDFPKCKFHDVALFSSANVGSINLKGSLFKKEASFKSLVSKAADFSNANFNSALHITDKSSFDGTSDFTNASFGKMSKLKDCSFSGDVKFDGALLSSGSAFENVSFSHGASFKGVSFKKNFMFFNCQFGEASSFSSLSPDERTIFEGSMAFEGCTFGADTVFKDIELGRDISFRGCSLGAYPEFSDLEFKGGSSFLDCTLNLGKFTNISFQEDFSFRGSAFHSSTVFHLIKYDRKPGKNEWLSFENVDFSDKVEFRTLHINGPISFAGAKFGEASWWDVVFSDRAKFTNANFGGTTRFIKTDFQVAPEFHGGSLHEDTIFSKCRFFDMGKSFQTGVTASSAYRILRRFMEEHRSKRQQAKFYEYELRSARNAGEVEGVAYLFSWLYDLFSHYGTSIGRPLLLLVGAIVVFWAVYHTIGHYSLGGAASVSYWDAFEFTMEQTVRPLYIWAPLYKNPAVLESISETARTTFKFLSILQAMTNFGLITLFVLAVRRHFKMD